MECGSDPPRRQRADGHSFASPQAVDVISFLIAAKLQCCALRVGVLRAFGPHQKETVHEPPGAIRLKCIPGNRAVCRLLRVSCSCNSIEVSCQSPFISSDTARESCRLMTGLVFACSPDRCHSWRHSISCLPARRGTKTSSSRANVMASTGQLPQGTLASTAMLSSMCRRPGAFER